MNSEANLSDLAKHQNRNPSISLCICTMNRSDDLNRCLNSVFQSDNPPDEVIVSDDSADPKPAQAVVANYPGVLYQPGPRRGLGANRNACIRSATSSHIMFVDDDVCVPSECFTIARKLINSCEPETIITGHEMNHGGSGRWTGEVRKVVPQNADFWGLQRIPVTNEYRAIVINAAIFPRSLFERALFDEHLRNSSDEIDMARHATYLGYRIVYRDELYVHHYPSPINRDSYNYFVHASRLYTTTKAYWQYDHSLLKTLAYLLLAPLQLLGSAAKKGDLRSFLGAIQSTAIASRYLLTTPPSDLKSSS